jgi:7-keto-8-aminopelargonate synthetase-like enzyme
MSVAKELENEGVLIPAIRYPTVPKGTARLRVALMATHTDEELEHTAHLISKAIKKYQ